MGAVMLVSVRIGDESRTILRVGSGPPEEFTGPRAVLLKENGGGDDIVINEAHREWNFLRASTTLSTQDRRTTLAAAT